MIRRIDRSLGKGVGASSCFADFRSFSSLLHTSTGLISGWFATKVWMRWIQNGCVVGLGIDEISLKRVLAKMYVMPPLRHFNADYFKDVHEFKRMKRTQCTPYKEVEI